MFVRRGRRGFNRFTWWRLGLAFLAAGTWLGGVIAERPLVTGAAIVILVITMLLGLAGRTEEERPDEE